VEYSQFFSTSISECLFSLFGQKSVVLKVLTIQESFMKKCGLLAILFGMAAMSFGLFSSCDIGIGLGAAVDTEPPTLEITNPPTSAIIRDTFVITGTWTDDGSIKDVIVDLRNTSDSSS
jgi:hypothetical protein